MLTQQPTYEMTRQEKRFVGLHLVVAIFALAVGSLFGPLQAFEWAGLDLYQYLEPIGLGDYYKGLTAHGVLNALVWTTFFITGFLTLTTIVGLRRPLRYPQVNQVGFWMMVVGLVMAAVPILTGWASVLYTFYPPLEASWAFYLGLTLVVVGQLDRGLRLLLHVHRLAQGESGRPHPVHYLRRAHHHGALAGGHARDCGRDPHDVAAVRVRSDLGHRSRTGSNVLLVHRSPARVLLAATGLHLVVRDVAQASRWQAVLRLAGPPGVLAVPPVVGPGRLPPPVRRSRHSRPGGRPFTPPSPTGWPSPPC